MDLFGSSDEDSDEGSGAPSSAPCAPGGGRPGACARPTHPVIRSLVMGLLDRALSATCADLRHRGGVDGGAGSGDPDHDGATKTISGAMAAEALERAAEAARAGMWSSSPSNCELASAAALAEGHAWHVLTRHKTGPHVCWREAFILSQVLLIGHHYAQMIDVADDEQGIMHASKALEHLDRAFIMGGPGSTLRAFGRVLEPLVKGKISFRLNEENSTPQARTLWFASPSEFKHMQQWCSSNAPIARGVPFRAKSISVGVLQAAGTCRYS